MSLQQLLDAMNREFVAQTDPAILDKMKQSLGRLIQSGLHLRSLQPGEHAPDFTLNAADGKPVSSRQLRTQGPLLLTFYRGVW